MKHAFFVTASIACGKSSFMQIAKDKGFECISADTITHELLAQYAFEIASLFKEEKLLQDKLLDKKALAKLVFSDEKARKRLENFLHPKIKDKIIKQGEILDAKNKAFFIELPLFFESENYEGLGKSILIYAPKELSLQRLMQRNALSKEEALQRIEAQMDIELKKKKADFIIENTASLEEFKQKCEDFLKQFCK